MAPSSSSTSAAAAPSSTSLRASKRQKTSAGETSSSTNTTTASKSTTRTAPSGRTGTRSSTRTSTRTSQKSTSNRKTKRNQEEEEEEVAETITAIEQTDSPENNIETTTSNNSSDDEGQEDANSKKPTKAPKHQVLTDRDELPKLWNQDKAKENGSYTFKIASWNVAGLRALIKKDPQVFSKLVQEHDIDVLCLQETKLQEQHLDDPKLGLRDNNNSFLPGYDLYYSCSTAKKGYAGTACFVKRREGVVGVATTTANTTTTGGTTGSGDGGSKNNRKKQKTLDGFFSKADDKKKKKKKPTPETENKSESCDKATTSSSSNSLSVDAQVLVPQKVSFAMGINKHDEEGRIIVVDFPLFTLCNVYVPNSGQVLARLPYRTDEWDKDFLNFVLEKQKIKPIMWLGDLNVAHTHLEVWNDGAKHLPKQAGVTPQERASFQNQLDSGFIDAFRHLHPNAKGHYSYWSQRAGNRKTNKGLRLDYFVCDPSFFDESSKAIVRDSYMLHQQEGSDHCPVVLEVEVRS